VFLNCLNTVRRVRWIHGTMITPDRGKIFLVKFNTAYQKPAWKIHMFFIHRGLVTEIIIPRFKQIIIRAIERQCDNNEKKNDTSTHILPYHSINLITAFYVFEDRSHSPHTILFQHDFPFITVSSMMEIHLV
jgi:hypothetical protein